MSPLAYLAVFIILAPLGYLMCHISLPMVRENAGSGYRIVAVTLCAGGIGLILVAAVALMFAVAGIPG